MVDSEDSNSDGFGGTFPAVNKNKFSTSVGLIYPNILIFLFLSASNR